LRVVSPADCEAYTSLFTSSQEVFISALVIFEQFFGAEFGLSMDVKMKPRPSERLGGIDR